ncbi:hypothetical protein P9486_27240, partial [Escherichia coli]|uniref:hypothetical protein n=1 Tax=Escherichia coli TaxID=562 RepID=UPI00398B1525
PNRRVRCSQIWEFIHSDRSRAFGPHGTGAFDRGNALEKWLDQSPSGIEGKSLMAALADARFERTATHHTAERSHDVWGSNDLEALF